MINKTIVGILINENLMKNIFSGIGYFVFVAGIMTVLLTFDENKGLVMTLFAVLISLILLLLASAFWLFHVARPIVKITSPDFKIPGVDDGAEQISLLKMVKRRDIWLYFLVAFMSLYFGWYLVQMVLGSTL